jgi:hypothetical protein
MADGDRTSLARGRELLGFDLDRHDEYLIQIKYDQSMEHIPCKTGRFLGDVRSCPSATRWSCSRAERLFRLLPLF